MFSDLVPLQQILLFVALSITVVSARADRVSRSGKKSTVSLCYRLYDNLLCRTCSIYFENSCILP